MSLPGMMVHTIDLQQFTATKDAVAGLKRTWSNKKTGIAARVAPRRSFRHYEFAKGQIETTHRVYVVLGNGVSRSDFSVGNRIVFETRNFDITGIRDEQEAGILLTIDALEVL